MLGSRPGSHGGAGPQRPSPIDGAAACRAQVLTDPEDIAALYRQLSQLPALGTACLGPELTTQYGGKYCNVYAGTAAAAPGRLGWPPPRCLEVVVQAPPRPFAFGPRHLEGSGWWQAGGAAPCSRACDSRMWLSPAPSSLVPPHLLAPRCPGHGCVAPAGKDTPTPTSQWDAETQEGAGD